MRRIYETAELLAREREHMDLVQVPLGGKLLKLPFHYGIDAALVNPMRSNAVEKWVELKARANSHSHYPTFGISLMKVNRALEMERNTGIPALLVVRFTDGFYTTYFSRFLDQPRIIRVGGRADRDDTEDQEAIWHLPKEKLVLLLAVNPEQENQRLNNRGDGDDFP